ncbi:hypothetical protein OHC33_005089 [Knufia fluminis]|uniref:Uncharacterized protein n=1 Tax=Knufia fluminis TaxID=191047 RepID=A0AAN8EQJ3_9EURO|nr:hypothetical protein OHC33_005089 [Knufia fluminis]
MENDRKPYQPVRVEMIGFESGLERFSKDGITTLPPVSKWRNNLTALSHYENLFFIASDDCIAVYQPEFPFQTLRRQPALLIKPELANRNALGYLSHRGGARDHCINHLMVGDLGSQEILLFVTDSGNVEAYYTSAVLEAIKRAHGQYCEGSSSDVLGLRPFFSHWVRQSAWGIDIHKEARMIAVSANVPTNVQPGISEDTSATITVFAFALQPPLSSGSESSDAEPESPDTVEWTLWDPRRSPGPPKRTRNYKINLAGWDGHGNNIPNICFANTSDDDGGIWLLSTDITGEMKSWQVWKASVFRGWNFGTAEGSVRPWMHHHYPGWNVAALDVSCFRPAKDNDEFIGSNKAPVYFGYHDPGQSFNISRVVDRHPANSHFHPSNTEADDEDPASDIDEMHGNVEDDDLVHEEPDAMEDVQSPSNPIPLIPDADWDPVPSVQSMDREIESFRRAVEYQVESEDDSVLEEDSSDDEEDSMEDEQQSSPPSARMQKHIRRLVTPIQNPNAKTPEIAMIHCSDSHVRLLGSPKARFPHIFCASMLRQIMPQTIQTHMQGLEFAHMDRLNMLQKIPELGIILIATQTGRVAVCALTRRPDGLLGFRVDWVLPTKKQERRGRRPEFCSLIGMAVAPIQGRWKSQPDTADSDEESNFEDREIDGVRTSFDPNVVVLRHVATPQERHAWRNEKGVPPTTKTEHRPWRKLPSEVPPWQATETSRRYRLMLTYSDMSVLTYELWRDVEKEETA